MGRGMLETLDWVDCFEDFPNLFRKEGLWGFYRGLFPRMTASSLWGTSMILTYEFLKRNCVVTEEYVD